MSLLSLPSPTRCLLAALSALLAAMLLLLPEAQAAAAKGADYLLEVDTGRQVRLPRPAVEVFVANSKIADVQSNTPDLIYLFGRAPGQTSVFAVDADGRRILELQILVTPNLSRLRALLQTLLPRERLAVQAVDSGVALTGTVSSPLAATQAERIVATFLGDSGPVLNMLRVRAPNQVNLRVRVAEVTRQAEKILGTNLESLFNFGDFIVGLATGRDAVVADQVFLRDGRASGILFGLQSKNADITAIIDALQAENLLTILAEPNLTAVSGETATFLAGGEFPVPVQNNDDQVQIEFKEFGVRLAFTPTVLDEGRINLRVRPEVSELSDVGAVEVNGIVIPALSTRRAETTVELASGQSFSIAGLLQNNTTGRLEETPGLASVPVLGALFRSERFRRNESELIIIVTPYVVRPVGAADAFALPTDGFVAANDLEQLAGGKTYKAAEGRGPGGFLALDGRRLLGPAGFILE